MSKEPEDRVTRARRRARLGRTRRERVGNAAYWLTMGAWCMERFGWLPDLPTGFMLMGMHTFMSGWITFPFRRRPRPLRLPGMSSTPLAELRNMQAQAHVHVRGRIHALAPMRTYLGEIDDAVYSRVEMVGTTPAFAAHRDYSRHRVEARDFLLVDETGTTVEIRMRQAEVKLPRRMFRTHDIGVASELLDSLPGPRPQDLCRPTITEHWLADGDEVEVVGTVEREADPRQEALPRELPTRPVLVSALGRPLTVQFLRAR